MKKLNQFGKIHYTVIFMLVVLFTIPTLLYHQYQLHGALVPAGKVIEVSGKVNELKYTREAKTVILKLNDPLFYDDWITTGPNSAVRVLLDEGKKSKEQLAFFIYENSKFKIDKAIVDKKVVVQHTQGILRTLAKGLKTGDEIRVVTPAVTVGVRGSDVITEHLAMGSVKVNSYDGYITVYKPSDSAFLNPERVQNGMAAIVDEKGNTITTVTITAPPENKIPSIATPTAPLATPATTAQTATETTSPSTNPAGAADSTQVAAAISSGTSAAQDIQAGGTTEGAANPDNPAPGNNP